MRNTRFKLLSLFALILTVAFIVPSYAAADDDDPPSRVARLGFIDGSVSFQPAGTDDWVSAVVNRPMTTGDKLWSDQDSRAELHIGSASLRLSSNTGFSFLNLTDDTAQLQLTAGTLRIRVKRLDENDTFEVDTPNLAFSILRPGTYKIHVNDDGNATAITVRGGEGEVTGGGAAYAVHAHEIGTFTGTDQLDADVESYGDDDDDFDTWCAQRDRREDLSISARYVSPDVIGYEDLDDAGGWRPVPEYGTVWFPHTTIIGWAPYHYGHWAYVAPWGYTWVDDAPWGFAPFHYGRWVFVAGAWGWVPAPPPAPGVVYVRPVYAPALVAWVGGPHFAAGFAVGGGFAAGVSVGWFPLGPREVYVPSYPVSRTYVTNVNISNTRVETTVINNYYTNVVVNKNVTVVQQTYVNQRVSGAVMATTPQAFTSAQPVARNMVRVDAREMATAPVNAITPAGVPPKQAVLGAGVAARVRPPVAIQNRAVVAKATPPPPPVSFASRQQAMQQNGGRPLAISQARQLQPQNAAAVHANVKIAPPATKVNPPNARGNPSGQNQVNNGNRSGQGNAGGKTSGNAGNQSDGFRKFGDRPSSGTSNTSGGTGGNAGNPGNAGNQNNNRQANNRPSSGTSNTSGGTGGNAGNPGNTGTQNNNRRVNDRPSSGTSNTSGGTGGNAGNPGNAGNQNNNRQANDRPPSARPGGGNTANPPSNNTNALDARHQQQLEQLHNQQDQERQKLEQQQLQERQKQAQQNANEQKQQELNKQHQQQLQDLAQKHDSQRQQLQQKQQQELKEQKGSKDDKHK
jgi:hypothetical protein